MSAVRIAWLPVVLAAGCFSKPDAPTGEGPVDRYGAISVGGRHACAVNADRELYCWGDNERGQIGLADPQVVLSPTRTGGEAGGWTAISAGGLHTCGLRNGGALCWGYNEEGQVAGGRGGVQRTPIAPTFESPPGELTSISAGGNHSCAIGGGKLWCWGDRDSIGLATDRGVAVQIGVRTDWTTIVGGSTHVCGIAGTEVLCFGENQSGQAGQPGGQPVTTPTAVTLPAGMRPLGLAVGFNVSCAIVGGEGATMGELWCWGENGNELIDASMGDDVATPTRVGTDDRWSQIALAFQRACGLRDGMAWCWGTGREGSMGNGYWAPNTMTVEDAAPIGLADAIALETGDPAFNRNDEGGCLSREGGIHCWGSNAHGRLGDGHRSQQPLPVEVPPPTGGAWKHVFTGRQHTCGQLTTGELLCWGANDYAQITAGIARGRDQACVANDVCDVPLPLKAPSPVTNPEDVVTGHDFTCARQGPKISCWGQNGNGQTAAPGNGFAVNTLSASYAKLLGGPLAACGNAGTGLTCWGPLPDPDGSVTVPKRVSLMSFQSISVTNGFACGLNTNGERVCWGMNDIGQIGDGNTGSAVVTEKVLPGTGLRRVAASANQGCLIHDTGQVSCWGFNDVGEVGVQPTNFTQLNPTFVVEPNNTPLANCSELALASHVSCALCDDRPYCWGYSQQGQLGRIPTASGEGFHAVQPALPDALAFVEVAVGEGHSCALSSDSRLFCWGAGERGQLGDGGHSVNLPTALGAQR